MKALQIIGAVILTWALSACSTIVSLSPSAGQNQTVSYIDGRPLVLSPGAYGVGVMVGEPRFEYDGRARFTVGLVNNSAAPVDFSTDNVSVVVGASASKVFSYDELVDEQRSHARWQAVALALGAAGRSMQASQAGYSTTTGTATATGPSGTAFGSYTASTYNPAAASAAQARANAETAAQATAIRNENQQVLGSLAGTILKRNTVAPGQTVTGDVLAELPKPGDLVQSVVLTVLVNGDQHAFTFEYAKVK